jgi:hypothetical protein
MGGEGGGKEGMRAGTKNGFVRDDDDSRSALSASNLKSRIRAAPLDDAAAGASCESGRDVDRPRHDDAARAEEAAHDEVLLVARAPAVRASAREALRRILFERSTRLHDHVM